MICGCSKGQKIKIEEKKLSIHGLDRQNLKILFFITSGHGIRLGN